MISKIQAIQSLVPGAEVSVAVHDDSVTWINYENPPITDEQIAAEQQRTEANERQTIWIGKYRC